MISLFVLLLERVGFIIIVAYLLLNIPVFKNLLIHRNRWSIKILLIVIFGLFATVSNFTGVEIQDGQVILGDIFSSLDPNASLANTRVLTIGISGLIGGPFVGILVGIISSLVRYSQGGTDPHIYVVSSILIGIVSGLYGRRSIRDKTYPSPFQGALTGIGVEFIQMLCILLLSSDFVQALELVQLIVLPMTVINSLGMAVFLSIIHSAQKKEMQARAIQTHDVLRLANATLPYFRSGLAEESCKKAASVIQKYMKVSAVSITNTETILAHVGLASDHHKASSGITTHLSADVLKTGKLREAHSRQEIGCSDSDCPLKAAIVIPLRSKNTIVGTLKLYFSDVNDLTFVNRQLAEGLGNIFSSQIELGEAEIHGRLLRDAEIKSLQAQVNPHFFFNAINTVSALIRVNSEQARELLIKLSHFFRSNLQGARKSLIPLEKELQQVEAYKILEQARFPNRFTVHTNIEENLEQVLVPPFILQILVENALKHAFKGRKEDNHVWIEAAKFEDQMIIQVKDNGYGLPKDQIDKIGIEKIQSIEGTGSALENLNKRLINLFGNKSILQFESSDTGTSILCKLPILKEENEHEHFDH